MERQIEILSNIKYLCEVEDFINKIFIDESLPRKIFCKIYISVTEAVNNAILHGNKCDLTKKVKLSYLNDLEYRIFTIVDEGEGFEMDKIPNPTLIENLSKESGRGIYIMNKYCDRVNYKDKGTVVELIFQI